MAWKLHVDVALGQAVIAPAVAHWCGWYAKDKMRASTRALQTTSYEYPHGASAMNSVSSRMSYESLGGEQIVLTRLVDQARSAKEAASETLQYTGTYLYISWAYYPFFTSIGRYHS